MNNVEKEYKSIVNRLGVALLFFLLIFNALVLVAQSVGFVLETFLPNYDLAYILSDLIYSLSYLFSFILPVAFFYLISRNSKRHALVLELKLPHPHSCLKFIAIVWSGVAIVVLMAYLNSFIFPVSSDTTAEIFGFEFSEPYMLALNLISTAIVPAFVEELLFRGMIISNLKPYSKNAAILISAVTFSLMHQNPMQLLYAFAAGIVFGIVYVETDSIWCCIAIHFVNNFISVMQSYIVYSFNGETANSILIFSDIFIMVGGMVCLVLLLCCLKNRWETTEHGVFGKYDAARSAEYLKINFMKIGFLSPTVIVFIVFCAVQSLINGVILLAY